MSKNAKNKTKIAQHKYNYKYLLHRIYKVLKSHEVRIVLRRMGPVYDGMYYSVDDNSHLEQALIEVDPTTNLLTVLCHEVLHHIYPRKTERQILALEDKIKKGITRQSAEYLVKLLSENLKYNYEYTYSNI